MSGPEILTFGCRLNIAESEAMRVLAGDDPNLIIVNSCAVTGEAVRQARQAIRRTKRERPDARIVVTGCGAQTAPALFAAMPEVDSVLGNREKLSPGVFLPNPEKVRVSDIMRVRETAPHMVSSFADHTRAFVEVQNGCDHRCTFCIIPYGRGNSRSAPVEAAIAHVRTLAEAGHAEIVLTGVDLTNEFVEIATELTRRCGLSARARFHQGSALSLPFADHSFDGATMLHVGMNIQDKASLFAEARRVLARGARFGIYDVMRVAEGSIPYPAPWAMNADSSFVETPATYKSLLEKAGFAIETEANRADLAIALLAKMRANAQAGAPALPNLPALLGPDAPRRFSNITNAVEQRLLAPIELIARAN